MLAAAQEALLAAEESLLAAREAEGRMLVGRFAPGVATRRGAPPRHLHLHSTRLAS
jgi:hypothetical protein